MDKYRRSRTSANAPIMDYGRPGYIIEYRTRNSSQINVAITTGRPRVLYRSIISPSITRIDLSRAASFVCRPGGFPRTNDSVAWQPFYFLSPRYSFLLRRIRRFSLSRVDFQGFATLSENICRHEESVSRGWVLWCETRRGCLAIEFLISRRLLLSAMRTVKKESLHGVD